MLLSPTNSNDASLPAGWERRWDQATKRYFYIDHFNRRTSWFDPRTQQTGGPPPAMRNEQPDEGVELRRFNAPPQPAARSTAYFKPDNVYDEYEDDGDDEDDHEATTSLVDDEYAFNVMMLKTKFPSLSESIIRDSLARNNNNLTFTTRDLVVVRERQHRKPTQTPNPPSPQPQQPQPPPLQQPSRQHERPAQSDSNEAKRRLIDKISRDFPSAGITIIETVIDNIGSNEDNITQAMQSMGYQSQSARAPISVQPPSETPQRQQPASLSDSDKSRRTTELKSKFPTLHERAIAIALECCNYDVNIATRILENDIEADKQRSRLAQETAAAKISVTQPSPQPSRSESPALPLPGGSRRSSADSRQSQVTPSEPSPAPSAQPSRRESRDTRSSTKRDSSRASPVRASSAAPSRPPVSVPTKTHPTIAKGPNAALRSGPNSSLPQGPRGAYAKGATSGLAKGPASAHLKSRTKAHGPDPSLVRGPQAAHRMAAVTA